jgi:fatty acid-binding protein DegV
LVEGADRVRTRRKGIEALYQRFFEKLDRNRPLHIAVLHGGVLDDAVALAERVRQEYQPVDLLLNITGPVLGLHTGPRALALCGYME